MPYRISDHAQALFTHNIPLKLLCLAVALCIWCFNLMSRETRIDLHLPVEVRNIPQGYALTSPPPPSIHITLGGPAILLNSVRRVNHVITLNMRGAGPGAALFSNLDAQLKLPEDVRAIRIAPATVQLTLVQSGTPSSEGEQR